MAETLKFGPEWLRNLSSDTHCRPQSPSAPTPRFKLAEHRYTKEEMLELFDPDLDFPHDLKSTSKVFVEKALEPVGFTAPSETEQKLLAQMSSNPSSRPAPSQQMRTTLSLSQLRNSESVRKTRGSGRLDPIYYRSSTTDDDDYARTRHFNRDPWDDSIPSSRGRGGGFSGRSFDDPSDVSRSMVADSWRGPKKKWNDDDTGNWRKQFPSQKPTNRSWREPWENSRMRGSDDPFREKTFRRSFSSSHAQNNNNYDDEHELPEWSTDDFGDVGTFDATGAFMSVKELERIEEQRQLKESDEISNEDNRNASFEADACDDHPRSKESSESRDVPDDVETPDFRSEVYVADGFDEPEDAKDVRKEAKVPLGDGKWVAEPSCPGEPGNSFSEPAVDPVQNGAAPEAQISSLFGGMSFDVENLVDSLVMASHEEENSSAANDANVAREDAIKNFLQMAPQQKPFGDGALFQPPKLDLQQKFMEEQLQQQQQFPVQQQFQSQQFQQQMFNQAQQQYQQQNYIKGFVPQDHEDAFRWFYRDPQGDIQGPFTQLQMSEWFSVGYFNMSLLVKQGSDHNFLPIGTLVKLIGSNPFQIPFQANSAMSHLKAQASGVSEQSLDLQQSQNLSQQLQQFQLKQQQQQQLDQLKTMQLMQMNNPRNEILNKLSTLQLLQTLQQQQQQLQGNNSRPLLEAMNVQSASQSGDNGTLSSIQHQLIQQHLQKQQQQQQLSQYLQQQQQQQQQQLGTFPHRSFSQSSNNDTQPPFIGGATASNSASFLLQANQTSVPQQAASVWKAGNDVGSYSSKNWDKGLMSLELSRPITAQALEQLQYLALEKQQQQRIDSLTGGLSLNGDQSNQLDGLSMGGVREHQLRALLQQEATRLMTLEDRQRIVGSVEMLERQKLEELRRRQEKADALRKLQQQEQLETFKKLKQQHQQQIKPAVPMASAALNLNSLQRQGQQLQRGSSPNFQSSSAAVNHQLEGVLNFQQHQSLMQKQQVNKSWSLTNQNWANGSGSAAVDMNWANSSYSQSQFMAPPSHSTTTSFTNTTSDPNHLSEDTFHRSRSGLYGSALSSSSANSIWLDGSCENHGFAGIASQQQQALGSNHNLMGNSFEKSSSLIMWCESELKDQVPNGNIPSIIQQLLECSVLPEILNIVKAFFADTEKAAGFALNFIERRNQLGLRKCEQLPRMSTATMLS